MRDNLEVKGMRGAILYPIWISFFAGPSAGFSFTAVPNASWFIRKAQNGVRDFVGKTPSGLRFTTPPSVSPQNEASFRWFGLASGSSDDTGIPAEHVLQVIFRVLIESRQSPAMLKEPLLPNRSLSPPPFCFF